MFQAFLNSLLPLFFPALPGFQIKNPLLIKSV